MPPEKPPANLPANTPGSLLLSGASIVNRRPFIFRRGTGGSLSVQEIAGIWLPEKVSRFFFRHVAISSVAEIEKFVNDSHATVISFDLFDTIVFRRLSDPNDIFLIQHGFLAQKQFLAGISAAGWVQLRKTVEAQLCDTSPSNETHIDTIYDEIGARLRLPSGTIAFFRDLELELERRYIRPYSDVVSMMVRLVEAGKSVVITTDTYLPEEFLVNLLDKWLPTRVPIFCSSTTNQPKRTGAAFRHLSAHFRHASLAHFGDNPVTDVRRARSSGILGKLTLWDRQAWLRDQLMWLEYRRAGGGIAFSTPLDGPPPYEAIATKTLAWRWATILADFVRCALAYAREMNVTDIWFLSRDCETIFQTLEDISGFPPGINCVYVFSSRAAWYPILAVSNPSLFEEFASRPATSDDVQAGSRAIHYVNGLLTPSSRRILMVDVGWLGRLQVALQSAFRPDIEVLGFYFSIGPGADQAMRGARRTFVEWDQSVCSQPLIEALMGYRGDSCSGYRLENDRLHPTFRLAHADRAPETYCTSLRNYLGENLQGRMQTPAGIDLRHLRLRAIRSICHLPDEATFAAIADWSVGISANPAETQTLLPRRGHVLKRLAGITGKENLWAPGGVYHLVNSRRIRAALIALFWAREFAKVQVKRFLRS